MVFETLKLSYSQLTVFLQMADFSYIVTFVSHNILKILKSRQKQFTIHIYFNLYKPLVISMVTYGSKALAFFLFLVIRKTPRKQSAVLHKTQKTIAKFNDVLQF